MCLVWILQNQPTAQAASKCGFWSVDGKPAQKDLRIQIAIKLQIGTYPSCSGNFSLHNDTTVFDKTDITKILGPSGYTLEIQPKLTNTKLEWPITQILPSGPIYLMPSLDINFIPTPIDVNKDGKVVIRGYMTPEALRIDLGLFLLHAVMTVLPTKCVLPPETVALVAIRASTVLATNVALAIKGHTPTLAEVQQLVVDFYKKAIDILEDLKYGCAADLLVQIIKKPALIVEISAQYLGLIAVWLLDYGRYGAELADASFSYAAPPKPATPTPTRTATPGKAGPSTPTPTQKPAPPPSPTAPVPVPAPAPAPPGSSGPGPVLAFYYPWYEPDDWASGKMSAVASPTYSGGDDEAIRRHIQQADDAGIDALVCAWFGPHEERIDKRCRRLLQLVQESGRHIRVVLFPDPASFVELYTPGKMAEALDVIRKDFTSSPAYFTWQGKPVVFFYGPKALGSPQDWIQLRDQADPNRDQLWFGGTDDFFYLNVYDALYYFDISWEKSDGAAMASYASRLKTYNTSHKASKPFVATVQPGYDDTRYRGQGHVVRDRANGDYYRGTWKTAIARKAAAVVLTSFNEFYEGSFIEPSDAFGDQYLQITKELIAQYRGK